VAKYRLFIQKCSWLVLNLKQQPEIVLQRTSWPRPKACHVMFKQFNGRDNYMPLSKNYLISCYRHNLCYTYRTKKTATINIAGR